MLSDTLTQKFTHLFKIIDFDHDGLMKEQDFISLAENVAIFRCLETPSEIEDYIIKKGQGCWNELNDFVLKQEVKKCNLKNWLLFMESIVNGSLYGSFSEFAKQITQAIFYVYDKDQSKSLSKLEYMCFFVSFRVEIKFVDICFNRLDRDRDMLINMEEFYQAVMQFFLSENTNEPGNVMFGNPESYIFDTRRTAFSD